MNRNYLLFMAAVCTGNLLMGMESPTPKALSSVPLAHDNHKVPPLIAWAKDHSSNIDELKVKIVHALNTTKPIYELLGIEGISKSFNVSKKASHELLQIILSAYADILEVMPVPQKTSLQTAIAALCVHADTLFDDAYTTRSNQLTAKHSKYVLLALTCWPDLIQEWSRESQEKVFRALGKSGLSHLLKNANTLLHKKLTENGIQDWPTYKHFATAAQEFIDRDKWYVTKLYERNKRTVWTLLGLGTVGGLGWMTWKYNNWQPQENSWFWEPYAARGAQHITRALSPLVQFSIAQKMGFGQQRLGFIKH